MGWDDAITPTAPLLLEGNNFWVNDLQAQSADFMQPQVRQVLAEYGLVFSEGKLPLINIKDLCKAVKH